MPEETKQEEPSREEPNQEIRKRAIKRVGAAAVLALVAAIGLTMMSRHKPTAPAPKPEQTVLSTEPAEPPASAVQATAEEPPPVSAVAVAETPPEHDAPPTIASPPPPPQVVNVPQAPNVSPQKAVKPAVAKLSREPETVAPAKPAPVSATPPVAEKNGKPRAIQELVPMAPIPIKETPAKAGEMKKPVEAQKTAEPAKPAPSAPPPPAPASPPPAIAAKGYAVQLGVFSNPANAIQMQEKLSQHGIQSYTETKLHVGPFKDKAEAEQAMAKVRSLGIGAVVVPLR